MPSGPEWLSENAKILKIRNFLMQEDLLGWCVSQLCQMNSESIGLQGNTQTRQVLPSGALVFCLRTASTWAFVLSVTSQ